MTVVRADTFVRSNVASGFGTATDGNSWVMQAGDGQRSVVADEGVIAGSSASTRATLGASLPGADAEVVVRFQIDDSTATAGVLARFTNNSNYYLARYDGVANIEFLKSVGGLTTHVGGYPFTQDLNLWWIKFRVQGTTISIRTWRDGTNEPATWNYTTTDTSLSGAGGSANLCGLYGFAAGTNNYDHFSVDDLVSVPVAHVLGMVTRSRFVTRRALGAQGRSAFRIDAPGGGTAETLLHLPAYTGGVVSLAEALTAADAEWRAGVDLLASDEATLLEPGGLYDLTAADRLLPGSASITLDTTQTVLRTLTLALRTSDGRYLPGASGYPSGGAGSPVATGLTWFNVRYRPWLDLRVGFDANAQSIYQRTYLGVFVLTQPVIQVQVMGAVAQLTLADKSALLQKPYRLTAANLPTYTASGGHSAAGYPAGTAIDAAMSDLATRGGLPLAQLHFEPTTATLPGDYAVAEGDEPWTHLTTLAATLGHVLYFDALGALVRRTNPLAQNTPPVWTFAPGPLSTIAQLGRTSDFTNTFNHIIVVGGSSATALVRGEATVTDPASPYHSNSIGDRVAFWGQNGLGDMTPDPTIGTVAAAQAQARLLLAQHLGQQESIQVQGRSIPQLAPYDRITVNVAGAGLATDAQLTQLTIPLTTSAAMSITAAKWLSVGS